MKRSAYIKTCEVKKTKRNTWFFQGGLSFEDGVSRSYKIWDASSGHDAPLSLAPGMYEVFVEKTEEWNGSEYSVLRKHLVKIASSPTTLMTDAFRQLPPFDGFSIGLIRQRMIEMINLMKNGAMAEFVVACLCVVGMEWDNEWDMGKFIFSPEFLVDSDRLVTMFGGRKIHHAYSGGWLVHTMEVCETATSMNYIMSIDGKDCDTHSVHHDIITAAALIHDIGKAFDSDESDGFSAVPTDLYHLHGGHLGLSLQVMERVFGLERFRNTLLTRQLYQEIFHCVESHHGSYGGVMPRTIPALCLQYADGATSSIAKARDLLLSNPKDKGGYVKASGGKSQYIHRVKV